MARKAYAIKVVLISLVFVPINIATLALFDANIQWWQVGVTIAALAAADILIIVLTGKPKPKHHANSAKSTN